MKFKKYSIKMINNVIVAMPGRLRYMASCNDTRSAIKMMPGFHSFEFGLDFLGSTSRKLIKIQSKEKLSSSLR